MIDTIVKLLCIGLALGGSACGPKHKPAGARLADPAVRDGMLALEEPLHECYERHKVSGYVQVSLRIESGGKVSSVELGPKHADSPTGKCVRDVMLTQARFAVERGPIIIRYPVLVR